MEQVSHPFSAGGQHDLYNHNPTVNGTFAQHHETELKTFKTIIPSVEDAVIKNNTNETMIISAEETVTVDMTKDSALPIDKAIPIKLLDNGVYEIVEEPTPVQLNTTAVVGETEPEAMNAEQLNQAMTMSQDQIAKILDSIKARKNQMPKKYFSDYTNPALNILSGKIPQDVMDTTHKVVMNSKVYKESKKDVTQTPEYSAKQEASRVHNFHIEQANLEKLYFKVMSMNLNSSSDRKQYQKLKKKLGDFIPESVKKSMEKENENENDDGPTFSIHGDTGFSDSSTQTQALNAQPVIGAY